MSYFDSLDKTLCCSCTACESICPVNCITMHEDKFGFFYPVIDNSKCINCSLCRKVCPFVHSDSLKNIKSTDCYALQLKDFEALKESSSGGAFTTITQRFCDENFVIFGVEMCSDLTVRHTAAYSLTEAKKFRKSKYVKSNINNSYEKAKIALESGKKVLFSGTGCQIAGLKGFLQKDYENLLTVDLVCHGTPSQKHFNEIVAYTEKKHKKKVVNYGFRTKKHTMQRIDLNITKISFVDETDLFENARDNLYMRFFNKGYLLMPSCYHCQYTSLERAGDITIADFWGLEKLDSVLETKWGVSLVICNTEKGRNLIKSLTDVYLEKRSIEDTLPGNPRLIKPLLEPKDKPQFLLSSDKNFIKAVKKYCKKAPQKILVAIYMKMPEKIKVLLKKIRSVF